MAIPIPSIKVLFESYEKLLIKFLKHITEQKY